MSLNSKNVRLQGVMPVNFTASRRWARLLTIALSASWASLAFATAPADPSSYSRTTKYTYRSDNGKLNSTTDEPNIAALCVVSTLGYDAYGNVKSGDQTNCPGASGRAKFAARHSAFYFEAASQSILVNGSAVTVDVAAGTFMTRAENALQQPVVTQYDPRFGTPIRVQDPNSAVSRSELDDFGRVVRSVSADSTAVVYQHCILASTGADLSSNTADCPAVSGPEVPVGAVSFTQSEPRDANNVKSGPYVRKYLDALGRTIRTVTQSFDGSGQPAAYRGAATVSDTVFDQYGQVILQTGNYFLSNGSSRLAGSSDAPVTRRQVDTLGRVVRLLKTDAQGSVASQDFGSGSFGYGSYGARRAAKTDYRYSGLTETITNDVGKTKTTERDALGQEVRVTDALGAQIAKQYDAFGLLIATNDALQNITRYTYSIRGQLLVTNDPDRGVRQSCYDVLGQVKALQNSKMRGSHQVGTCPDVDDSGVTATAQTNWTTFAYDVLGRVREERSPSDLIQRQYDAGVGAVGRVSQTSTATGVVKRYAYDSIGRAVSSRVDVTNGPSFATSVAYDPTSGRLTQKIYPTGFGVGYAYTNLGYLQGLTTLSTLDVTNGSASPGPGPGPGPGAAAVPASMSKRASASGSAVAARPLGGGVLPPETIGGMLDAGTLLWTAQRVGADGLMELTTLANGATEVQGFDANGRITSQDIVGTQGDDFVNNTYQWDSVGNLRTRVDNIGAGNGTGAVSESFDYDDLNRLKRYTVLAPGIPGSLREVNLQYNALGMMLSKSDVGNYEYLPQGGALPHAPKDLAGSSLQYDLNGNVLQASASKYQTLTYTEFDKVSTAAGANGGPNYTWLYDEAGARIKEVRNPGASQRVTWYLHPDAVGGLGFEREVNSVSAENSNENRHYLMAGGATVGLMITTGALPSLTPSQMAPTLLAQMTPKRLEYWHRDHLGSLVASSAQAGGLLQRYAYDPFGKRRFVDGRYDANRALVIDTSPNDTTHARGFTGHEERNDIGIINMNGRIFDDQAGLFMQADPVVTDPSNLQSYSRYAYAQNNPLNSTDPSGFETEKLELVDVKGQRSYDVFAFSVVFEILSTRYKIYGRTDSGDFNRVAEVLRDQLVAKYGADSVQMVDGTGSVAYVETTPPGVNPFAFAKDAVKNMYLDIDRYQGLSAVGGSGLKRRVGQVFGSLKNFADGGYGDRAAASYAKGEYGWWAANTLSGTVYGVGNVLTLGAGSALSKLFQRTAVALDTNAIIAAVEGGKAAEVIAAIGGRMPVVSRTAVREFLAGGGDIEALRKFLSSMGGRIASAGTEAEAAALRAEAAQMGRSLGVGDSRVAASAAREEAEVITADKKFRNFLNAIGLGGIGF